MENKQITFKIVQIKTEQFATFPEFYQHGQPVQIRHEIGFGADKENGAVAITKTASFFHVPENTFIKIVVTMLFQIEPQDWQNLKNDATQKIILPQSTAVHFTMLLIGTLRGILHNKTEGTIFNQYIFPPFNVHTLVPNDIIFD
jgi:hypothetical protein